MKHIDAQLRALLLVLTNSPKPDAVARALALGALHEMKPSSVTIHAHIGDALELRSAFGLKPDQERLSVRIPLDAPTPEVGALQTLTSIALDDLAAQSEFAMVAHHEPSVGGALMCLPLVHEARGIGVLGVRMGELPAMSPAVCALLDGTAAAIALWLLTDARTAPAPAHSAQMRVTERQQQVLDGLRRGLTNAAIAAELGFAVGTIKADITAMSALFGAIGRENLMRKAERAGF